jgi:hypothetical protein
MHALKTGDVTFLVGAIDKKHLFVIELKPQNVKKILLGSECEASMH